MNAASRTVCLAAMLISALLAGCSGVVERKGTAENPVPNRPSDRVNLSGYSQAFRLGYADGCDSAGASQRRDEGRYKSDGDYRMGWSDGYSTCQRRR
jgi:outer membrane biogenesis lipoprotein LolB